MKSRQDKAAQRPYAVFDIDGTVIRWQLYHAIVNQLIKQGHLPKSVGLKIHDARMTWKNRRHVQSFGQYESTLVHAYQDALTNLKVDDYLAAVDAVFEEYKDQVYTFSRDLIADLKNRGYLLFAISGSQQEVVDKLAAHYGFDAAVGQVYEHKDGRFTGEHTRPMSEKGRVLAGLVEQFGAVNTGSTAVGDSDGDIPMLEMVETPIAFNPNQSLYEHATNAGWQIVVERKNVIYELNRAGQDYKLNLDIRN